MSSKTKSSLKIISILIVVVVLLGRFGVVVIPALAPYIFWLLIIAFLLLFLSTLWLPSILAASSIINAKFCVFTKLRNFQLS